MHLAGGYRLRAKFLENTEREAHDHGVVARVQTVKGMMKGIQFRYSRLLPLTTSAEYDMVNDVGPTRSCLMKHCEKDF